MDPQSPKRNGTHPILWDEYRDYLTQALQSGSARIGKLVDLLGKPDDKVRQQFSKELAGLSIALRRTAWLAESADRNLTRCTSTVPDESGDVIKYVRCRRRARHHGACAASLAEVCRASKKAQRLMDTAEHVSRQLGALALDVDKGGRLASHDNERRLNEVTHALFALGRDADSLSWLVAEIDGHQAPQGATNGDEHPKPTPAQQANEDPS